MLQVHPVTQLDQNTLPPNITLAALPNDPTPTLRVVSAIDLKRYSLVRATESKGPIAEGKWYFEVKVLEVDDKLDGWYVSQQL